MRNKKKLNHVESATQSLIQPFGSKPKDKKMIFVTINIMFGFTRIINFFLMPRHETIASIMCGIGILYFPTFLYIVEKNFKKLS